MDQKQIHYCENIFASFELGEDDVVSQGAMAFYVSIFDHWLSVDEAESCSIINYETAVSQHSIEKYNFGEKQFIQLYQLMAVSGVVCASPLPLRFIDQDSPEIKSIILDSLREKKRFDLYFIAFDVRVAGGFDRTDLFLTNKNTKLVELLHLVDESGLYILRA